MFSRKRQKCNREERICDELAILDRNPAFELYEFSYIDGVRHLIQKDNLVEINNAHLRGKSPRERDRGADRHRPPRIPFRAAT